MLRLSLVSRPMECDTTVRPAASTSQTPITAQWWRAEKPAELVELACHGGPEANRQGGLPQGVTR